MKIAVAGVVTKEINEHPLGGTEAFTYMLVEGLVKRGHEVTLYCAKGSKTPAQHHVEICNGPDALGEESNLHFVYPYSMLEVRKLIEDANKNKFDIIHINFLKTFIMTYFADQIKLPILYTMHRDFFERKKIFSVYNKIGFKENEHFVFVSKNAQKLSLLKHNAGYIYNGIDVDKFPYLPESNQKNLLWFSRIDDLKGPAEALDAAIKADTPIILSGTIDRGKYQDYFDEKIKPLLNNNSIYEPPSDQKRKIKLYQSAKAFLFPIQWEEPFGLVLTEAMACGTPVISYARGAIPEIVEDGVTGFVVNSSNQDIRGNWIIKETGIKGLVEAIKKINTMPKELYAKMRQASRNRVEKLFTIEKTVQEYELLYQKLLDRR